mmetsp:Transcript_56019/g.177500  ORF Transcript_56019/g.177500 Transcript_56019/m.177500 type:complete len:99 (-) Transcript_56019:349-645(-)|eukprot:CAMPEP_0182861682 /NCGR_PEP_ID=MMETSP0034_2-20130328/5630_1 /TAXON_ID=156128 /ORGANISM="Nephroselmis pyriformis, Strain CCMP717" /LENGTH=98 /DNA_ID=CAMNT_0024993639 /DNA_START=90 /DNA_END=386 /DNA_ORIENTATION=-
MAYQNQGYPPGAPPQPPVMAAFQQEEEYCGPISWSIGCVLCIFLGPIGLAPLCCPCDKRPMAMPIVTLPQSMMPPQPQYGQPPAQGYAAYPPPQQAMQ